MIPKPMFRAAAGQEDGSLVLYMYDDIGPGWMSEGVLAKDVAAAIAGADGLTSITVRLNSPGGDVFEGIAIFNLLRSAGVPVNVMVDGLAASAASVIAMAGDQITMGSNAMMMIHNAWMIAMGDADDLRKSADTLDKISGVLVDTYVARSGQTKKDVTAMMACETWLTAQEAVEKGFATAVYEPDEEDRKASAWLVRGFRLEKRFRRPPTAVTQAPETAPAVIETKPAPPETVASAPPAPPDLSAHELELLALELSAVGS